MNIIEELYSTSYSLPSENDEWVERQGNTVPMNVCTRAADEIERLRRIIYEFETPPSERDAKIGHQQRTPNAE